ncbi:MAG TPA: GNAT family N-acetyltransferase [Gaiellaceae bacterium]|nr:GNAT family N-acetyltransferase [Gaiellaceae bacterium]
MNELRRVQRAMLDSAAQFRDVERVGPFSATFARSSDHPAFNYAVPDEAAQPSAADVAALVEIFRARDLRPRLEYVAALGPAVEPALTAAGFAPELRAPLMVLRHVDASPPPKGIELLQAVSDAHVRAAVAAQHEAYGELGEPSPEWLAGVRRSLDAGGALALALEASTGEAAGAGQCTPPLDGAAELTSIGVRASFRRRGIAAALTSVLAQQMREREVDLVYLTAAGESEARIYARVGFERIGESLYISRKA